MDFQHSTKSNICFQSCPLSSLNVIDLNANHYEADDEPNKPKGADKNDHDLHGAQIEEGRPEEDKCCKINPNSSCFNGYLWQNNIQIVQILTNIFSILFRMFFFISHNSTTPVVLTGQKKEKKA